MPIISGADTRVCRVETRLDAFGWEGEMVGVPKNAETSVCAAASKTPPERRTWWRSEKRRDESRRGREESLRHVGWANVFIDFGGPPQRPMGTDMSVCATSGSRQDSAGRANTKGKQGSALLTVLWLSAALAAIAFSLANTVLGETDRTSTEVDGLRCYYLAAGAIHRAYIEELWSFTAPAGLRPIPPGATYVNYLFPSGNVHVDIIPETAKLDVNHVALQDLFRLVAALGVEPERAQEIAIAIDDWRRPAPEGSGPFDSYYLSLFPSFPPSHASIQQIEELLRVRGITPDIFYGTYVPSQNAPGLPRLSPRPGLIDCLSVYGSKDRVDANTASPAVLAAVGLSPYAIDALLQQRRLAPLTQEQLGAFMQSIGAANGRLRVGGNSIITLRATAQLRLANGQLSDLKRTVAAQVKFMPTGYDSPVHILRWYDMAWSN